MAIFDPATGQEIASTADANEADVDNAVMSALAGLCLASLGRAITRRA
ncbi:hypothetical protein ACP0HM_04510 [Escherichia coli]